MNKNESGSNDGIPKTVVNVCLYMWMQQGDVTDVLNTTDMCCHRILSMWGIIKTSGFVPSKQRRLLARCNTLDLDAEPRAWY